MNERLRKTIKFEEVLAGEQCLLEVRRGLINETSVTRDSTKWVRN